MIDIKSGYPEVEERPLITFALFAYNQEKYIREAVESAFAQTYEPLEIILSDDFSTDSTYRIMSDLVESYKGRHSIKLFRNDKNLGLVGHINKVFLDITDSDLVVVQAGDDVSLPERTALLWQAWESAPCKPTIISSAMSFINTVGEEVGGIIPPETGLKNDQTFEVILNPNGRLYGASSMYHKDVFKIFGALDLAQVEDGPLSIRGQLLGPSIALEQKLVKKRITESNMSGHGSKDYKTYYIKGNEWRVSIYQQVLKDLKSENFLKLNRFINHEFFHSECRRRMQIHADALSLVKSKSFFVRLQKWLVLLPHSNVGQSINSLIYIFPDFFIEI